MNLLSLIPAPWMALGLAVALAGSHGWVYLKGRSSGVEKYESYKAQVEGIARAQVARLDAEKTKQKALLQKTVKSYEQRLSNLTNRYDIARSELRNARTRTVPALSEAPICADGTSKDESARRLADLEERILGLLEKGDSEITKLQSLQEWIRQQ